MHSQHFMSNSIKKRFVAEVFPFYLKNELKCLDLKQSPLQSIETSVFSQCCRVLATGTRILKLGVLCDFEDGKGSRCAAKVLHRMAGELREFGSLRTLPVSLLEGASNAAGSVCFFRCRV